jgi:hypothetical protein
LEGDCLNSGQTSGEANNLSEVSTRNKKIVLIYDRNDFDNQLHFETTLANPFGFLKDSANATKTKYSLTFLPIALSNE